MVQEEIIEWAIYEVQGFKATVFVGNQVGIEPRKCGRIKAPKLLNYPL